MPDSHQESMKTKMKNYLKRVVARPNTTARKKGGHHPRKKKSDYLGGSECCLYSTACLSSRPILFFKEPAKPGNAGP